MYKYNKTLYNQVMKNPGLIEFQGIIQGEGNGRWIDFPFDLMETFEKGNLVPIIATFDGIEYQGSIAKMGGKYPMLLLRNDIRAKLGKDIGEKVKVTVKLDDKPRIVEVPTDLEEELKKNSAKEIFDKLSFTHRKEYVKWIEEAKKPETRKTRILKTIELVLKKRVK